MTALLPGPAVELEVCLGVGRQADAGVWDASVWDASVWGATDTAFGDWVDVTCDVQVPFEAHAGTDRGDGVVTRWEAATVALTLHGAQYNPRQPGPWFGVLGPGLPVRIRWRPAGAPDWRPGFSGFVDDDGFHYEAPPRAIPRASIACTDGVRVLNSADLMPRASVGDGESAGQRVARIADAVVWPDELRAIGPGGVAVRGTTLEGNAWDQLLLVADTDLAHLWVDAAGVLRYVPQGRVVPQRDPAAIITCVPGDGDGIPAAPPVAIVGQQPTILRNVANIQRSVDEGEPAGAVVTLADDESIARYMRRPYTRRDLVHVDDGYSLTIAQTVLTGAAWPSFAPEAVELTSRAALEAGYLLLAVEPDMTLLVRDLDGTLWTCQPAGWTLSIGREEVRGVLALVDVSQYIGSAWDSALWDIDRWGY